jgi:hypothetical protein
MLDSGTQPLVLSTRGEKNEGQGDCHHKRMGVTSFLVCKMAFEEDAVDGAIGFTVGE